MHTGYEYPTSTWKYMTLYTAKLFPSGLSQEEAQYRFRKYGPNALPPSRSSGLWHVLRDLNREPIFLLLFAASGIYFFLGEASDALLLLSFVLVALGIVISRQRQTEHVLDALRELSSPRALVMRDGKLKRIPSQELVIGDVFSLQEGDRVAADGRLVHAHSIELDESLLTGESVAVTKAIHDVVFSGSSKMMELKTLGVRFSLDDFGTGYSSLSYLGNLPIDELKIDRSFFAKSATQEKDAAIIRTIAVLAQSLQLELIAEGVENQEQQAILDAHGCHIYKGFLFSRPLTEAESDAYLRDKLSLMSS